MKSIELTDAATKGDDVFVADNPLAKDRTSQGSSSILRDSTVDRPSLIKKTPSEANRLQVAKKKKASNIWTCFLLLVNIFVLGLQTVTLVQGEEHRLLFFSYLTRNMLPFAWAATVCGVAMKPENDVLRSNELFFVLLGAIFGVKTYTAVVHPAVSSDTLLSILGSLLFMGIVAVGYRAFRRQNRKFLEKFEVDPEMGVYFRYNFVPRSFVSVSFSMLYVSSETFGCLFDDNNAAELVKNCVDIANSNENLLCFLVSTFVLRIFVVPLLGREITIEDLIRFNLVGREMLQLILYCSAGLLSMCIFATSEEINRYVPNINGTSTTEINILSQEVIEYRSTQNYIGLLLFGLVPLVQVVPKEKLSFLSSRKFFTGRLLTTMRGRIAPFFSLVLEGVAVISLGLSGIYVYLAVSLRHVYREETLVVVQQWRIHSSDAINVIFVCVGLHFIGNPTKKSARQNSTFLCLGLFFVLQCIGNVFQLMTLTEALTAGAVQISDIHEPEKRKYSIILSILCFFLIFGLFRVMLHSRRMLGELHIEQIDAHLQRCFLLAITVVPVVVFLYFEPQSCIAYASEGTYSQAVCLLNQRSNFAVSAHVSAAFIFYVIFGYKLETLTTDGLFSFRDVRFHHAVQIFCAVIASIVCFVIYGMRISEKYEHDVYRGAISPLDSLLIGTVPYITIVACWAVIYLFQYQHSERMEKEAMFHRRSIDEQTHDSVVHRTFHDVDLALKKVLVRFDVPDEDARIAGPFRAMLFFLALLAGLLSLLKVIFDLLGIGKHLIFTIPMMADIFFSVSFSAMTAFIFTDLTTYNVHTKILDITVCGGILMYYLSEAFHDYYVSGLYLKNIAYVCIIITAQLMMIHLKSQIIQTHAHANDILKHHAYMCFGSFITTMMPLIFLASEQFACVLRFSGTANLDDDGRNSLVERNCESVYLGCNSITLQVVFFQALYGCMSALEGEEAVTIESIATLKLPCLKLLQLVIIFATSVVGIMLFGIRREGEKEDILRFVILFGYYIVIFGWFLISLLAFFDLRYHNDGGGVKGEGGSEQRNDSIDESVVSERESGSAATIQSDRGSNNERRSSTAARKVRLDDDRLKHLSPSSRNMFKSAARTKRGSIEGRGPMRGTSKGKASRNKRQTLNNVLSLSLDMNEEDDKTCDDGLQSVMQINPGFI